MAEIQTKNCKMAAILEFKMAAARGRFKLGKNMSSPYMLTRLILFQLKYTTIPPPFVPGRWNYVLDLFVT
jgi:hypothetical protein